MSQKPKYQDKELKSFSFWLILDEIMLIHTWGGQNKQNAIPLLLESDCFNSTGF